jgi:hypothetical protein
MLYLAVETVTNPEEAAFLEAVARKEIPDTELARVIWRNMKLFPDAVLLTRVGGFYEV